MRKIIEGLAWIGYNLIGSRLPDSHSRIRIGQRWFRRVCAKGFCASIGTDVNIERKAVLPRKLYLGNHSGIGKNSYIQGELETM